MAPLALALVLAGVAAATQQVEVAQEAHRASVMYTRARALKLGAHQNAPSHKHVRANRERVQRMKTHVDGPVPCEDGMIGGEYNCSNMDLVDYVVCADLGTPLAGRTDFVGSSLAIDGCWVSDIWGWTDPATGYEYALVGMWDGTSIVSLADPTHAQAVVFVNTTDNLLDGWENIWRDIKVVGDVMYVGAEVTYHGIQAFDLTQVEAYRASATEGVVPTVSADWIGRDIGSTHNIVTAESLGWVMGVGMEPDSPACSLGIYDVSDSAAPYFVGCYYDPDINYVHDAHCVQYAGPDADHQGKHLCALWAETDMYIVDLGSLRWEGPGCDGSETLRERRRKLQFGYVEDYEAPLACELTLDIISNFTYDEAGYVHQGWFSEDHEVLYCDDEEDEILRTHGGDDADFSRCYLYDVRDLDAPVLTTVFVTPSAHPSIDHNLYVKDGYIYQAAYTSGARVRQIVNSTTIEEVAFADLETTCECVTGVPECSCDSFLGIWTYFPYFDSGVSIAGGSLEGLFVLNATLM